MPRGALVEKFIVPPVSVLDSRQGYWLKRKREWRSLGLEEEFGRPENMSGVNEAPDEIKKVLGKGFSKMGLTTSKFDPVLSEILCTWFSKHGDIIVDPFSGGAVRGIISGVLGREYYGIDIRKEQVLANVKNLNKFNKTHELCINPKWYIGDSFEIEKILPENLVADLIFSCPPYVDLEVYSENPKDLSTMHYEKFIEAYTIIINKLYNILKENGFAVFVVGDVRDKKGYYYDFISDTKKCFINAGFKLYNELIFIELIGTASMKCGRFLKSTRKITKTHQNVLVFTKGDAIRAAKDLGEIKIFNLDNLLNKQVKLHEV